ncbi:MAG: hypothetical protein HPY55_16060 [Firmicutes bacterium]|nr:hypothetical protein [Bacillota bacterium]
MLEQEMPADLTVYASDEQPTMSKGEALLAGLQQIDEGLKMIASLGGRYDLVATMVGSKTTAQKLRDVIRGNKALFNLVVNIVKAKNNRLAAETVEKVIGDFLDTLFDLSKPYRP